jgi:hypothetical protein
MESELYRGHEAVIARASTDAEAAPGPGNRPARRPARKLKG